MSQSLVVANFHATSVEEFCVLALDFRREQNLERLSHTGCSHGERVIRWPIHFSILCDASCKDSQKVAGCGVGACKRIVGLHGNMRGGI